MKKPWGDQVLESTTDDDVMVKIRPVKLEDALSLQRNCLPAYTLNEVKGFLEKDVGEMRKGKKVRLVADVNGEVVGNLEIHFSQHPLTFYIAEVSTVVVSPKFRRRGIATKMIESGLRIAGEKRMEIVKIGVEAKNTPAVKLYTKVGFEEYGRLERGLIRKGEYDDLILLKKDLQLHLTELDINEKIACANIVDLVCENAFSFTSFLSYVLWNQVSQPRESLVCFQCLCW